MTHHSHDNGSLSTLEDRADIWDAAHAGDGNLDTVKTLVKSLGDPTGKCFRKTIEERDGHGQCTVLHLVCVNGATKILKFLIEIGADVNTHTHTGRTPLHDATYHGNETCVKLLLAHGADVLAKTRKGDTALDICLKMQKTKQKEKDVKCFERILSVLGNEITLIHQGINERKKRKHSPTKKYTTYYDEDEENIPTIQEQADNGKSLDERLMIYSKYTEDVGAEGHCQFQACAHQVKHRCPDKHPKGRKAGKIIDYKEVRRRVVAWLRKNRDNKNLGDLANFAKICYFTDGQKDEAWGKYLEKIEKDEWGDHLCLVAMAEIFNVPIRVWKSRNFTADNDQCPYDLIAPFGHNGEAEKMIEMGHMWEAHYLSVMDLDE